MEFLTLSAFGPIVATIVFIATIWFTQKSQKATLLAIAADLHAITLGNAERDKVIHKLELDMTKVKTELDGTVTLIMAEMLNLKELVKSLRDLLNSYIGNPKD